MWGRTVGIILVMFQLVIIDSNGQSLSRILEAAEKSLASKNYYDAYSKYREALEFEPTNASYLYKTAECARLFGAYKMAAMFYDSVLHHELNNFYPLAGFWLGQTRQIQGDYSNAILAYKIFNSEHSGEDSSYLTVAKKEIQACEWASEQLKYPIKGLTMERMSDQVNSQFSDFAPELFKDDLVYSSLRFENKKITTIPKRYNSKILISHKSEFPVELLPPDYVAEGLNIAHTSYNKDYTKVYFTICEDLNDYDKRCDLFTSTIDVSGNWSSPVKLPDYINIAGSTSTQPHLCYLDNDVNPTLFYVSNRSKGKGGLDIWYVKIDETGNYSEPVNCADINTNTDDITPYYHPKSKTLYFSSKGYLGMGGFDVYQSKYVDHSWAIPKNTGVPVNSSFDDVYYVITNLDTIAYLASNRTGTQFLDDASEACCLDLFKINLLPCDINLDAFVYQYYTKKELKNVNISLIDLDRPTAPRITINTEQTNTYRFAILCDKNYKLIATKQGYLPDSISFNTGKPAEFTNITKKLFLKPNAISLDVLSFHKITKDTLNAVTISLIDLDDPQREPIVVTNLNTNLSQFNIIPCHKYKIIGSKPDFATTIVYLNIDCATDSIVVQKIFLEPEIYSLLPISLYFDNDRPDPNTFKRHTLLKYSKTYEAYYAKKIDFLSKYLAIQKMNGDTSGYPMDTFFENQIKYGKERFDKFLKLLEKDLANGKRYEIFVKGYASPLAKPEYNLNLSQRRIVSIYNEFYRHNNGVLIEYIRSKQLKLSQKPFGETNAPTGISDKKQDLRSIFTIEASRERRVDIIEIKE
ncbi:MAG: PD40 domain-containing protein [Saprospiraceae bacterium]|nr:PD40 domain-containing protein [Saprospiraceae bacterium]MBK7914421.1 PD40 domain-containing protein [Saprospiraceae bacterium]